MMLLAESDLYRKEFQEFLSYLMKVYSSLKTELNQCVIYFTGSDTVHFQEAATILEAYKHAEYFEAVARMAWEANQKQVSAEAYSEEIVNCILQEFNASRTQTDNESEQEDKLSIQLDVERENQKPDNLYNYP